MPAFFISTTLTLAIFTKQVIALCLLFLISCSVVAEQSTAEAETTPANAEKKEAKIPPPASMTQQYNDDLKHYLPANKVKPILAGPDDYITLISESTSVNNKGVAILLPDWQQGATNPKAINFLRNKLPSQGWTTISIQPTSKPKNYPSTALKKTAQQEENKTAIDDYKVKLAALLNAVIDIANNYPGIVMIIAQGNHGALLVELLDKTDTQAAVSQAPNALVLLSSYLFSNDELLNETNTAFAKKLAYSEYPILDLYLKYDNAIVLAKVKERNALAKKEMKVYYRQRQLNNSATGYYPEQELQTQINSWLKSIGW